MVTDRQYDGTEIVLRRLRKRYDGAKNDALAPLDARLPIGKITVIVGKSGCGKTTLLHLLAGLIPPTEGDMILPCHWTVRDMAMVFQEPRLLPWLTVRENMAFAKYGNQPVANETVERTLADMGLAAVGDVLPYCLSGGMAQRVAIGRALCANRPVLLMDEPFSALDYFTRRELQGEVRRLQQDRKKTIVFITHDVEEAVLLGDYIICLRRDGKHRYLENTAKEREGDVVLTAQVKEELISYIGGDKK